MIGARARIGGVAFDGIQAIQLHLVSLETPPRGERARVTDTRGTRAQEVGVEREDDVGVLDDVLRVDVIAECEPAAGARVMAARGIPLDPFRLRKPREELLHLRGERRRRDRFGENPDARALAGFLRLQRTCIAALNALNGRMSPRFVMFRDRSGS